MAKSVLELAVGTGQWDAGLRKAKSALDNFTQSQGGLQQALAKDSENIRKFVQMMGKTESTAKTAKGQMNDYKSTIEQLTMQYNRMTEAQKKVIGQDYLQAIEQMKQKYQSVNEEIQEMNRSLNNVKLPDMKDGGGGLFSGLGDKMSGALQVFGGNMLTKAAGAVANLGSEMADMVKQGVELARQGEGIRIAFERLGRGDILDGLREATHGTVTDIELMKAAVKFNDFKLPLDELGTMLAFAQQKAKDTGQSVDYMVDSIVTGLGRKSLMILDNLGLSATEVKEKMKETGDMTKAVGAIIREQMSKAGDYMETAADRAAQANVSLQNKMEELGRKFAPLEEASNSLWTSMKIGILDVVGGPLARLLNGLTEAGRMMNAYGKMGGSGKVGRMTANLAGASEGNRQSIYQQQQAQFWKYINPREQQIKDIRAWQSGERNDALQKRIGAITEKYGSLDATKIQAEVDAAKKMLSDYQAAAKQILQPIEQKIVPTVGDSGNSGGGGRSGGSKSSSKSEPTFAPDSIAAQQKLVADLTRQWNEAGAEVRNQYVVPLVEAEAKLKEMRDQQALMKEQAQGKLLGDTQTTTITATVDVDDNEALERLRDIDGITIDPKTLSVTADTQEALERLRDIDGITIDPKTLSVTADTQEAFEKLHELRGVHLDESTVQTNTERQSIEIPISSDVAFEDWMNGIKEKLANLKIDPIKIPIETTKKDVKAITKAASLAADAVGNIGDAFNAIEDPAAKVMGTVMQAIASIALGFAQAASAKDTTASGWAWLAWLGAGTAALATTISTVHSLTGYANGGMIKGNSYSGDNIGGMVDGGTGGFVGLNAGEVVLNAAQQNTLAQNLSGNLRSINVVGKISGTDIILSADRTLMTQGKQLAVWGR